MRFVGLSLLIVGCAAWATRTLPPARQPVLSVKRAQARSAVRPVAALQAVPLALALNSGLAVLGTAAGQAVLTPSGLVHAWALGVILHATLGWSGWCTCVFYLVGGSAVTKLGRARKEALGIAEGRGGARGPENVWGSAATAALCALATSVWPSHAVVLRVGYVASLATKLGDTFASEVRHARSMSRVVSTAGYSGTGNLRSAVLVRWPSAWTDGPSCVLAARSGSSPPCQVGKAYGRTTYLIITLQRVPAGTEGAVSLEGTLAGEGQ